MLSRYCFIGAPPDLTAGPAPAFTHYTNSIGPNRQKGVSIGRRLGYRCPVKFVSRWMRESFASGVVGVALLAVLGPTAAVGNTPHSSPSIACPVVAGLPFCCGPPIAGAQANALPCCPVATPTATCCTPVGGPTCCPNSPCPSSLSIATTPDPVTEGHATTISGSLTGGTVAAQNVVLYERLAGQAAFSNVATTQTDASGGYQFSRSLPVNVEWYAQSGSVMSATVSESVLAAVVLHPSSVRPAAGTKDKLSGTIAPSHAGERVALQRLRKGRWVTVARPRLNARSHFAVAEKMRGRGVERFRVVLAADARNARSVSGVVAITAR